MLSEGRLIHVQRASLQLCSANFTLSETRFINIHSLQFRLNLVFAALHSVVFRWAYRAMDKALADLDDLDSSLPPATSLASTAPAMPAQQSPPPPPAVALKQLRSPSKPPPGAASNLVPQQQPVAAKKAAAATRTASAASAAAPPPAVANRRKADGISTSTVATAPSPRSGQEASGQCWIPIAKQPKAQNRLKVAKTAATATATAPATFAPPSKASGSSTFSEPDPKALPKPPSTPPPPTLTNRLDADEFSERPWRSGGKWSDSWSDEEEWPGSSGGQKSDEPVSYGPKSDAKWADDKSDGKWSDDWWKWSDDKRPDDKWQDDKWADDKRGPKSDDKWQDDKWPDDKWGPKSDDKWPDDKWKSYGKSDDKWSDDKSKSQSWSSHQSWSSQSWSSHKQPRDEATKQAMRDRGEGTRIDGPRGGKKANWQTALKGIQRTGSPQAIAHFLRTYPCPETKEDDKEFARQYYSK